MIAACCGFCREARQSRRQSFGPEVLCGCGCGQTFPQFDLEGRERRFVLGHAMRVRQRAPKEARP
jgi:hypothetical protein